ncbi:hypothetical protein LJC41_06775 [Desulfosarcina sp. OttesenSCG-928-G17]|nr:hypothetical protein [Desulfosarcina sp. OttesenSCG-928-G17]
MTSKETKSWSDRTAGTSNIENLNFPADRIWKTCTVTVEGRESHQNFDIQVKADGKVIDTKLYKNVKKGEKYSFPVDINKQCAVDIGGKLSIDAFPPASGTVTAECSYDEVIFEQERKTWSDETIGISCIENLFLPDNHAWDHAEVFVENHPNRTTGCQVTLIANGEIIKPMPGWIQLNGSEQQRFSYPVNARVSLIVAGYITNKGTGSGADITLIGYYKKGA